MNTRNWSIRSKIVAMVSVPLAGLLALWMVALALAAGPALRLRDARTLVDALVRPGERLIAELQNERRLAAVYLAGSDVVAGIAEQRARTDEAIAAFRRHAADFDPGEVADPRVAARVDQLHTTLDGLAAGREAIDGRRLEWTALFELYNGIIDAGFQLLAAIAALPGDPVSREAQALVDFGVATEMLGRADALLGAAFHTGRFGPGEYRELLGHVGAYRVLYPRAFADLPDSARARYQQLTEGAEFGRLRALEETLLVDGAETAAPPIDPGEWRAAYDAVREQLRQIALGAVDELGDQGRSVARRSLFFTAVVGLVGVAAVAVALVIAVRMARSLVRRLTGLRAVALDLAGTRLPDVVDRLRAGETVDVRAETPSLDYGTDEIGQLGHAFSAVHRTAIRSAVQEATARRGWRETVLALARRSQSLLHRQLTLLDTMERKAAPEELRNLFTLDHLATQMRRHTESLLILSGAKPGRGWSRPVPMIDVIRGAISEIEHYARVDVDTVDNASLIGRAVGDVIHLLAELIENATLFSPAETRVRVRGSLGDDGYTVEVEDRGFGMTRSAIDEVNQLLAAPPEFDPAHSVRLGLFVVAHLSARHRIQVTLRSSAEGGVIAAVRLPTDLVIADSSADAPAPAAEHRPPTRASLPTRRPTGPGRPPAPTPDAPAPAERAGDESRTAAPSAPTDQPRPPVAAPAGAGGLPRRVRQQSLAPQLRDSGEPPSAEQLAVRRSPQRVRSVMSALQAGAARGRQSAAVGASTPSGSDAGEADRDATDSERSL